MVVEDDRDIRESLRDVLEGEGYLVCTAEDGEGGLAALRAIQHPCLVLLDLMMPVMNGLEFLDAVRECDVLATIPVLVVSAYGDLAQKATGSVGFVKKPIDLNLLLRFVDRYCRE